MDVASPLAISAGYANCLDREPKMTKWSKQDNVSYVQAKTVRETIRSMCPVITWTKTRQKVYVVSPLERDYIHDKLLFLHILTLHIQTESTGVTSHQINESEQNHFYYGPATNSVDW